MQILQHDNKLHEEIINEAISKKEKILKKAAGEADEIIKNNQIQIENIKKELEIKITKEIEDSSDLLLSSVDIDIMKKTTCIINDLIEDVFKKVKENIINNKYKDLLIKLIIEFSLKIKSDNYIISIGSDVLKKISKDDLLSIKLPAGKIKDVEIADINDGLFLFSGDKKISFFISIDRFLDSLNPTARTQVYEILIEGKNNG